MKTRKMKVTNVLPDVEMDYTTGGFRTEDLALVVKNSNAIGRTAVEVSIETNEAAMTVMVDGSDLIRAVKNAMT